MLFFFLFFGFCEEFVGFTYNDTQTASGIVTFRNCLFEFNKQNINMDGNQILNLIQCTFIGANSNKDGAIFRSERNNQINFKFVCIYRCQAREQGGAFFYKNQNANSHISMQYVTVCECYSYVRVIYIQGGSDTEIQEISHCNFSQNFDREENNRNDLGIFLLCNIKTNIIFSSFENNTACKCLLSIEKSKDNPIKGGIINNCNFVNNHVRNEQLILFTNQSDYTIKYTIIKGNYGNESFKLFRTVKSTILVSQCTTQSFSPSGTAIQTDNCDIRTNMAGATTYTLVFYHTRVCYADNPFITPDITPISTPLITPFSTPFSSPFSTPFSSPFSTPLYSPFSTPLYSPFSTPLLTPINSEIIFSSEIESSIDGESDSRSYSEIIYSSGEKSSYESETFSSNEDETNIGSTSNEQYSSIDHSSTENPILDQSSTENA